MALNGYHSLNVANGLGRNRASCCQDCLSQSEAFPPLSPGRSNVKPGCDITLRIKGSANALSGHFVLVLETGHFIVGWKRVLSQDLAATSNCKNVFISFA